MSVTPRRPLAVQPHPYIGDVVGRPLDRGMIYFGEPDKDPQDYPITVYLDPEQTKPAHQPIRTKGGFINVFGDITEIFADEILYSLKVLDCYGRLVFYKKRMHRDNITEELGGEIVRAQKAESALQSSIDAEATRAKAAESDLSTGLAKEVSDRESEVTRLDEADAVLQAQINSVGGGKLAYKTYAEMIADKSNIAAKSSIDIIADTDDKNGTYLYDGSNFVKSQYDIENIITSKVQNTFSTYTQMTASNLNDGAYALVADDTEDKNGIYFKEGGEWVESKYDLINTAKSQVKKYIENELLLPPDEVKGELAESMSLRDEPEDVVLYTMSSYGSAISLIFPVEADTYYTIKKELSDRFRVAEFDRYPYEGLEATGFYLRGRNNPEVIVDNDGVETQQVSFTTSSVAKYVVAYISITGETPKVSLREGGSFELNGSSFRFRKDVVFGDAKLSDISKLNDKIELGKNLFKNEYYLEGNVSLRGAVGSERLIVFSDTGTNTKTAVVKIEPDTTYTISKSESDRFRIGLCDSYPVLGRSNIEILAGQENDKATEFTFTSRSSTNYLVLYLSYNSPVPSEVQVEIGDVATPYESYGYKLFPEAKSKGSTSAYDYAGVGDANYISKDEESSGAWKDAQYTIPATDDTDTLQALFDSAKGVVSLEPGKKYKITRTITYNPERVKLVKGNMAHIVCIGDIEAFQMTGTLSGTASAKNMKRSLAYNEMSPMVVALKITNPMEVLGTAFVVSKVMSPIFLACNFAYLRRGIVFRGTNRNAILNSNHIYACSDYGIHFEEGGNIHQINIVGNHISYCRKNIFSENHHIYNIQITGNDIETSSYPSVAECNMHFLQTTAYLVALEIVGNTIEDHHNTNVMIKLEGSTTSTDRISCVTISGNVTGNSAGSVIEIGGASGVEILGQFTFNYGYVVDVTGNIDGLKLSTQSRQAGGGLFRAVGDYSLKDVTVSGNNLSRRVTQNPILVDVLSLVNCNFSGNDLRVINDLDYPSTHTAPISIHADTVELVRVDNNTIATNDSSITKAVEVVARNSSQKGSMRGNMASYGSFTAPESFAISEND